MEMTCLKSELSKGKGKVLLLVLDTNGLTSRHPSNHVKSNHVTTMYNGNNVIIAILIRCDVDH